MHEIQAFTLVIFAIPIAIMCWILWAVTDELGDLEIFRRRLTLANLQSASARVPSFESQACAVPARERFRNKLPDP